MDLNTACSNGGVFDYQSIDSATDPTSEIPVNEELTNAADCPTLADVLHKDVTVEKEVYIGYYDLSCIYFHFSFYESYC